MAARDIGTKYLCFKCNTKFYDLKKPEPICPKCGANQKEVGNKPSETRRSRLAAVPKLAVPVPVPDGDEEPAAEEDEDVEVEDAPADEEDV